MANVLTGTKSLRDSSLNSSLRAVWMLRLALGFTTSLGAILFFLGTSWDIQWHVFIGRDRTLIPPHQIMLTGVGLSGLAALAAVLIETLLTRRSPAIAKSSTHFADAFHSSLGAYVAGFAALMAAVAFPLDSYWHSLYGIDVAIWAPFHVMFIAAMAIVALGAAYMLVSAANLAADEGALGAKRIGYIGVIIAFATMMSIFTFLLFDAYGVERGTISLGFVAINLFPVLAALLGAWTFSAVAYTVPWRGVATLVAVIYLLLSLIVALYVPPATGWLVVLEHLTFRKTPGIAIVTANWPVAPLAAAILIDILAYRARRRGWSSRRFMLIAGTTALIGFVPVPMFFPFYILRLTQVLGGFSIALSLLLGLLGSFIGVWFGCRTGKSMQLVERRANA